MENNEFESVGLNERPAKCWRQNVYVSPTQPHGLGVFALKGFNVGDKVLVFRGPRKRREDFKNTYEKDHSLQINLNEYIGPSGGEDDFVNHSCCPNTYLIGRQTLVAHQPIFPHEEITVDYATCTEEPGWQMVCHCGATHCRKTIKSYSQTSKSMRTQRHFQTWLASILNSQLVERR